MDNNVVIRSLVIFQKKQKHKGLTQLLVLTTQTTDWFQERGFKIGSVDDLPEAKKQLYNYQRQSKILIRRFIILLLTYNISAGLRTLLPGLFNT